METDKKEIARQAYDIIRTSADSNIMMQGISGIFGFPWNLAADGASVFTHYIPMLSKIRTLYSRSQLTDNTLKPLITGIMSEILFDLLIDKGLGSIPIIGVYFNIICAKAMTWRLGILFSMLSARGEVIDRDGIAGAVKVIRLMFPQHDIFKFIQPDYKIFEQLVSSMYQNSMDDFNDKIRKILDIANNDTK